MKISLNWLREFIPLDLNTDQISQILTDIGLEVEGVEEVSSVRGGLEGVVAVSYTHLTLPTKAKV